MLFLIFEPSDLFVLGAFCVTKVGGHNLVCDQM